MEIYESHEVCDQFSIFLRSCEFNGSANEYFSTGLIGGDFRNDFLKFWRRAQEKGSGLAITHGRSADPLKVQFARHADAVDAGSGPFEHHAIVAGSQSVQALLEALQLLDAPSVRNGIARDGGEVYLVDDLLAPAETCFDLAQRTCGLLPASMNEFPELGVGLKND
ncbi:MAG: hypothetical protein NW703_18450 [Nitrospiraceae bacterium]